MLGATSNRVPAAVLASAAVGFAVLHRLGTSYGSTGAERRSALPGDDLVRHPHVVATHARTIDAPPEEVWRWYAPRWVDVLLFPDNLWRLGRSRPRVDDLVPLATSGQAGVR